MTVLLLILSGAVSGMTYAVYNIPYIIYLALIPFFYVIFKKAENTGAVKMYFYGFAFFYPYFIAVFHWFVYQYPLDFLDFSKTESILYILLAVFGVALLMTLLFSFIPVAMRFYAKLFGRGADALSPLFISCIWCLAEWLNSKTFMAVPWARLALTQQSSVFYLQTSSILGSFFISFIIAFFASSIAYAVIHGNDNKKSALICVLCASCLIFTNAVAGVALYYNDLFGEPVDKTVRVSAIQGNIASTEKTDSAFVSDTVDRYLDMIYKECDRNKPDIIITPESAIPVNLRFYTSIAERFSLASEQTGAVILLGAFDRTEEESYNSIFMFTPDGGMSETVYNKRHLVPFGEFLPFRPLLEKLIPLLGEINSLSSDLTAGDSSAVFDAGCAKIGSVICFDSIFELLSAESVRDGAQLLAVSTNDSWFVDSAAIYEHNGHAILRAVENRRFVVRAANTGLSSIITPRGDVLAKIDPLLTGSICAEIPLRDDITFFTAHPNLFPALLAACSICVFVSPFAIHFYGKLKTKKQADALTGEQE